MDSGTLFLYELKNCGEPGGMPKDQLHKISAKHWFEAAYIGMNRQYLAKGANEQIDLRVRIHYEPAARINLYAVLGNGDQFRIVDASHGYDSDGLRITDLSLMRLEEFFDVEPET